MMKSKIALIVDVRNWAFENIAKNIETNLNYKYDFQIFYIEDFQFNLELFEKLRGFDLVHFFWRDLLFQQLRMNLELRPKKLTMVPHDNS